MKYDYTTKEKLAEFFPKRPSRSNKGDYGRVFCVCGSYTPDGLCMSGAAYLSALAAYRCGSGIVNICTPQENYVPLVSSLPEAIYTVYDREDPDLSSVCAQASSYDCVLIGCGLGRGELAQKLLSEVLLHVRTSLVIDADALNIMSENPGLWELIPPHVKKNTVITPHPGEMSRLCGKSIEEILNSTESVAADFARKKGVVCVLKDNKTVICDSDVLYINSSGNPGMSVAGSGDVLAGIVASLLARKDNILLSDSKRVQASTVSSAAAAVYLHGLSGDLAAEKFGEYSMLSSDIAGEIPNVLRSL